MIIVFGGDSHGGGGWWVPPQPLVDIARKHPAPFRKRGAQRRQTQNGEPPRALRLSS